MLEVQKNFRARYYISFLALGDNLISLSMLEQLDERVGILGTKHTKHIARLIGAENKFEIEVMFEDIPAFYDIRRQGIRRAIQDFFIFTRYVKKNNTRELVFEKKDFRSFLISILTNTKIYYPNNFSSMVYKNRKDLISSVYGEDVDVKNYPLKIKNTKKILINPLTRVRGKNIKRNHLMCMINILKTNGCKIYLIDLEKRYKELEKDVDKYLINTSLRDVKVLMKECDLYIGGDSFLVHLAYFLKRNYFIIFYNKNNDFLPPNMKDDFCTKVYKSDSFEANIKKKFVSIGLIK